MGKFSLGNPSVEVHGIQSDNLYLNDDVAKKIERDMQRQLEIMRTSLVKINSILNQTINQKYVKNTRIDIFRGWSRVTKSQAEVISKLKSNLTNCYSDDLKTYSIKLLDDRITAIEKKLAAIEEE